MTLASAPSGSTRLAAADDAGDAAAPAASPARRPLRMLYIAPGPMMPASDPRKNKFAFLSRAFEGAYLTVLTEKHVPTEEVRRAMGRFEVHHITRRNPAPPIQPLRNAWFWVRQGLALSRARPFDVVVTYGPFTTALAGLVVARRTGAKLIVEYGGHPFASFAFMRGWIWRVKAVVAPFIAGLIARLADGVKVLHPTQLEDLELDLSRKLLVFHNFVPISLLQPQPRTSETPFLFTLGFPLQLKGADILIRAFLAIADEFPDLELRIGGHRPRGDEFDDLAAGHPRIKFLGGLDHATAMQHMAQCTVFVLASRTEGMARVLIEAAALGRPTVSSAVGGIPYYLTDGEDALLFPSEDVEALADRLRRLLRDPALAQRLAARAQATAGARLSEEAYVEHYRRVVERLVGEGTVAG